MVIIFYLHNYCIYNNLLEFCTRSELAISNVPVKFQVRNSKTVEFRNFACGYPEGPWGMWVQGSTHSQARYQDEVGWLVLRSDAFTPGEIPRYSFFRRSGREECEEKSQPLGYPGPNPGSPDRSQAPCRLCHLGLKLIVSSLNLISCSFFTLWFLFRI